MSSEKVLEKQREEDEEEDSKAVVNNDNQVLLNKFQQRHYHALGHEHPFFESKLVMKC